MQMEYMTIEEEIERLKSEIRCLNSDLLMVSKLSSDQAAFLNPLNAAHAKLIRDRVLEKNDSR
jgi:hypothetical protein